MKANYNKTREQAHRLHKRELEITVVLETLAGLVPADRFGKLKVLEFGSGEGWQIEFLRKLGPTVASDIYTSQSIRQLPGVEFHETSITRTPFGDGQFDVIYSNHVLEHIDDLPAAFAEMRRIGSPGCLYVFSLPTQCWLLFDVPSQYYNRARRVWGKIKSWRKPPEEAAAGEVMAKQIDGTSNVPRPGRVRRILNWILPVGHGVIRGFLDCYRAFTPESWRELFVKNGFVILKARPLLRYASSEWPIVPTTRVTEDARVYSSILFVMRGN